MKEKEALRIMKSAIDVAISKGVFNNLEETKILFDSFYIVSQFIENNEPKESKEQKVYSPIEK